MHTPERDSIFELTAKIKRDLGISLWLTVANFVVLLAIFLKII